MRYLSVAFLFLTLVLLSLSCAKQTTPTGGPKDTIPPKLLLSTPPNNSTHFKSQTFELSFDEYIQLDNPRENLLVTPNIDFKNLNLLTQKRKVLVEIDQPLDSNTTYTFNFRESIKDLNEKNPAEHLSYVFSTGTYIDSLSIEGIIIDPLHAKVVSNTTVALTAQSDTFDIFEHKPIYTTRSNKDGTFQLSHLKSGSYLIYAFNDKNNNLIVDSKTEAFGFLAQPVTPTSDSTISLQLCITNLDSRPLTLISSRPYNTYYNIRFNKSLATYSLSSTDSLANFNHLPTDQNTNIKIYLPESFPNTDSLALHLVATDSVQNTLDTLLYAKHLPTRQGPEKFSATTTQLTASTSPPLLINTITFTKPLQTINIDSIYIQYDTLGMQAIDSTSIQQQNDKYSVTIRQPLQSYYLEFIRANDKLRTYLLYAPTSFISIENDTLKSQKQNLDILTTQETSQVIVNPSDNNAPAILQLLDNKFQLIQQIQTNTTHTFSNIKPGSYYLRIIIDQNANGQWDPSNYKLQTESEPIYYYVNDKSDPILLLKPNWEVGPLSITQNYLWIKNTTIKKNPNNKTDKPNRVD